MCLSTRGGGLTVRDERMRVFAHTRPSLLLYALCLLMSRVAGAEPCSLLQLGELPVTMAGMSPTVHAKINGADALFIADSGAFFSTLTPAGAQQFQLKLKEAPFRVRGAGGEARAWETTVQTFTIFNADYSKVTFLVAGNDLRYGVVGVLGQNVFRLGEVEYDLANGVIRILRVQGDCATKSLAYWANAQHQSYSVIDIDSATPQQPHNRSTIEVNGHRFRVVFDTGNSLSVLSLDAAGAVGISPTSPGVLDAPPSIGFGHHVERAWLAPVDSFKIGDEEVKHTKLRIGAVGLPNADMLIGADFFLSHHILIATSQRKLYFTYNGGPVFNLAGAPLAASSTGTAHASGDAAAESAAADGGTSRQVAAGTSGAAAATGAGTAEAGLDASAYARRGAAATARHDYEHAIADLTRACELAPSEASYFYERGIAYQYIRQGELALADFDQAIKLKSDDVPSLMARASLRAARKEAADQVLADLDAASHAAPREAEVRLQLGDLYRQQGNLSAAIAEYTTWLESHNHDDVQWASALAKRCVARALAAKDLDHALDDCDAVLRVAPKSAGLHNDRGLVLLRLGHYDKAIDDFDTALKLQPKNAWALYGRGIAKVRKGDGAGGQADIAAATALAPKLAEDAARYGITP